MTATRKVLTREKLLSLRAEARAAGKTVVHCHGCFDIVHPGHIHHLQFARSVGDILLVSVSSDSNVNKGVDRPLIPDDLRAASLAALECVDWVYVNPTPTAVELLDQVQPDVYVKGREYERNQDPRFLAERETVERHGGRVIFSSGDVIYSSTALIGNLDQTEVFNHEKVHRLRQRYELSTTNLQQIVHRFRGKRVLVIGDYVMDRYHFCDATEVATEGPMMSLRSLQSRDYDGGAAIVAAHVAAMGALPVLITSLADDELSHQTELRLRSAGVEVQAINNRRQLITKHRFLVDQTKLFKVDEGSVTPLDSRSEQALAQAILNAADGAAAVIFSDFGYGLISAGLLDRIMTPLRAKVPVITADVSGRQSNLIRFKNVDLLCPTEREVRETLHDFASGLGAVVSNLLNLTSSNQAIITLGKQGLVTFDKPEYKENAPPQRLRSEYIPSLAGHAIDPLGAGDALLAAASLTLCAGGSLQAAAFLGSLAAAAEVQQLGNQPVSADRLLARLDQYEYHARAARLAS